MVYIPRISFRTGINPSLLRSFPTDGKYTGTQKLMLTATRIFGTKIGGNMTSGMSPFNKLRMSRNFLQERRIDVHEFHRYMPALREKQVQNFRRATRAQWLAERAKRQARRTKKK